jgi:Na+-transporting methylmalonyl-CoA/oxaloacetate decarboxylase gamma subunit
MGLIFASLGLLMLIIMGLDRIFRAQKPPAVTHASGNGLDALNVAAEAAEGEEEVVAAIAVALSVLAERQRAAPRTTVLTLSDSSTGWRAAGRMP